MFRNRKSHFRPSLEALESRWCPACDVRVIGSALFITGDAADNEIAIIDDGSGVVTVECDGDTSEITDPIRFVVLRAGHGDDSLFAYSVVDETTVSRAWLLDMGGGDDTAEVIMEGMFDSPQSVSLSGGDGSDQLSVQSLGQFHSVYGLSVNGGRGDDFIVNFYGGTQNGLMLTSSLGGAGDDFILEEFLGFRVNGTYTGVVDGGAGSDFLDVGLGAYLEIDPSLPLIVLGFDVAQGGRAVYSMAGGDDHDALLFDYVGRIDGQLAIHADGGRSNDDIFANVDIHAESSGQLFAAFRGGDGDDNLDIRVRFFETELVEVFPGIFFDGLTGFTETPAPLDKMLVLADGGKGFDTCIHTDWVSLLRIEDDQPL